MNTITAVVVAVVVGVVGILISDAVITAGNFSGTTATLLAIVPLILCALILFAGISGFM
jgi:UDP:flavonoid glycosyltransferase YjiC (YdhE family)